MRASKVSIQRLTTTAKEYSAVTVFIGDLQLRCDVVDDRTIRLAKRLADDHGAFFYYDDENAEQVRRAIGLQK